MTHPRQHCRGSEAGPGAAAQGCPRPPRLRVCRPARRHRSAMFNDSALPEPAGRSPRAARNHRRRNGNRPAITASTVVSPGQHLPGTGSNPGSQMQRDKTFVRGVKDSRRDVVGSRPVYAPPGRGRRPSVAPGMPDHAAWSPHGVPAAASCTSAPPLLRASSQPSFSVDPPSRTAAYTRETPSRAGTLGSVKHRRADPVPLCPWCRKPAARYGAKFVTHMTTHLTLSGAAVCPGSGKSPDQYASYHPHLLTAVSRTSTDSQEPAAVFEGQPR